MTAFYARGKAKGKGISFARRPPTNFKGRRNIPPLENRRERLKELKKKSKCKVCGKVGHWAGDPECKESKPGHVNEHIRESLGIPVSRGIDDDEDHIPSLDLVGAYAGGVVSPRLEIYDSDDSPNEAYTAAFGLIDDTDSDLEIPAMTRARNRR